MHIRFWQNLDSITCVLGIIKLLILFMCVRFWQNNDFATCLLGSQNTLDVAYVHKALAESRLYYLFTWSSKNIDFAMHVRLLQNIDSATCLLGSLNKLEFAYVRKVLAEY